MLQDESRTAVTFLIIVACMIFFLLLTGLVFLAYGGEGVQSMLMGSAIVGGVILVIVAVIVTQLVGAYTSNLVASRFIAAQQSNDNSDVAKFKALGELYKTQRIDATYSAKSAYDDERRIHKLVEQRTRLLASQPQEAEPVSAWDFEDEDEDINAEYQVLE